jgi:hypothetical protein
VNLTSFGCRSAASVELDAATAEQFLEWFQNRQAKVRFRPKGQATRQEFGRVMKYWH